MPCIDPRERHNFDGNLQREMDSHRETLRELNARTAMLCKLLRSLERGNSIDIILSVDNELLVWWNDHKKFDKQRGE